MYGGFQNLSNTFSYARMNDIVQNPIEVFRRDTPTLIRIDITYGKGSSASWLFDLLQAMFIFLGVTDDRFSKEQVLDLARTIVSQYGTIKMAEMLLFLSRFKAGKYGRFYGGDSYALVVTEALNVFIGERARYYEQIENEEREHKRNEDKKQQKMTFEEWKRMKEANGEKVENLTSEIIESIT